MGWGLVEEDNIETLGIVLAKLAQKDGEAVGIQPGSCPPEGVPRRRLHRCIEPVEFIQRVHQLPWLRPDPRQPTEERQVETETTFILAEDAHRLVGRVAP